MKKIVNPTSIIMIVHSLFTLGLIITLMAKSIHENSYDYVMEQLRYVDGYVNYTNIKISELKNDLSSVNEKILNLKDKDDLDLFTKDELKKLENKKKMLEIEISIEEEYLEKADSKAKELAKKIQKIVN